MRRIAPVLLTPISGLLLAACSDAGREPTPTAVAPLEHPAFSVTSLGGPLPGLSSSQLAAFNRGKAVFQRAFTQGTGLGPIFNASSCAACHGAATGAIGGAGAQVEIHFTNLRSDGTCDPLTSKGGTVHQDSVTPALFQATGLTSEPFPNETHQRATRSTPDLFGFGLLAEIPSQLLVDNPAFDPNDSNGDGISGRAQLLGGEIGRFGRKGNGPTLPLFNAGALLQEMGITNASFMAENNVGGDPIPPGVDPTPEPEISSADLDDLNAFVRFLAPPPPLPLTPQATTGQDLFASIGCTSCHTPSFRTGFQSGIRALSGKEVRAFTDLLLH
ncbi:MAG TPA: di-heme oxidoredictase family protein, partial [Longimicrobiaceae bacterium]|nr:di-heme oxidoredictase family protein [Longimicrobiaceae bacterium]